MGISGRMQEDDTNKEEERQRKRIKKNLEAEAFEIRRGRMFLNLRSGGNTGGKEHQHDDKT